MLSNVSSPSSLIRTICGKYRVIVGASRVRSALHSSDRSTASAFERTRSNWVDAVLLVEAPEGRTGRAGAGPEAAEAGEYTAVHGAIFFTYSFTLSFYFSFSFSFSFFIFIFLFLFLFRFSFFFSFFFSCCASIPERPEKLNGSL